MNKVMSVRGLSKKYVEGAAAVNSASFDLFEGEIIAIYGESGCGKSTLLKMISGYLEPDQGRVYLNGEKLAYPSEVLMPGNHNIEIVKQDYDLFPNHKVEEVLDFKLRKFPDDFIEQRIEELLLSCGLNDYRSQVVKLLSGGQQQRVAIAQAIANEPDVVLMDEPFNSLDRTRRRELRAMMKSIVKQYQLSIVLVTHDSEDLFSLADRVVVMRDGCILQEGEPFTLYKKPCNEYVARLMGELSIIEDKKIRPEDLVLDENKSGNYVIKNKEFLGAYYRYGLANNENSKIIVYTTINHSLGTNCDVTYKDDALVKITS